MLGLGLPVSLGNPAYQRRAASSPPYGGHTFVTFGSDYLTLNASPFAATYEYFTMAFGVHPTSFAALMNLLWGGTLFRASIAATTGIPQFVSQGISGALMSAGTQACTLNTDNYIQIAGRCATDIADSTLTVWVNGVASQTVTAFAANGFTFGTYSTSGIGGTFTGGNLLAGKLGLVWLAAGVTEDYYIVPEVYDFQDEAELPSDGTVLGATPQVFFGGAQTAAGWNAGANQGSGADWTMVGAVA